MLPVSVLMIPEPVITVDPATTYFGRDTRSNKAFGYDAEMESYCDDSL